MSVGVSQSSEGLTGDLIMAHSYHQKPQFLAAQTTLLGILVTWQLASPRRSDPSEGEQGWCDRPLWPKLPGHIPPMPYLPRRPTRRRCGRGLHRAMDTRRWGSLGAILEAGCYGELVTTETQRFAGWLQVLERTVMQMRATSFVWLPIQTSWQRFL